jgi:hypothetical protein
MKLVIAAILLFASSCFAATWDGQHDDLTVFTVQLNSDVFGVAGVPGVIPPGFPASSVEIFTASTDRGVTAFRVTIEYTDNLGAHTESRTSSVSAGMMALAFFGGVQVSQISSVSVTRLRDGQTTSIGR